MAGEIGDFELRRPLPVDPALAERITNNIKSGNVTLKSLLEAYDAEIVSAVISNDPELQEILDPDPRGGGYAA
jgi:hypothetical protein